MGDTYFERQKLLNKETLAMRIGAVQNTPTNNYAPKHKHNDSLSVIPIINSNTLTQNLSSDVSFKGKTFMDKLEDVLKRVGTAIKKSSEETARKMEEHANRTLDEDELKEAEEEYWRNESRFRGG